MVDWEGEARNAQETIARMAAENAGLVAIAESSDEELSDPGLPSRHGRFVACQTRVNGQAHTSPLRRGCLHVLCSCFKSAAWDLKALVYCPLACTCRICSLVPSVGLLSKASGSQLCFRGECEDSGSYIDVLADTLITAAPPHASQCLHC